MTSLVMDLAAKVEALATDRRFQLVVLLLLVVYGAYRVRRGMGDYEVYERAAARAVAGESLYRLDDPHRYLYAPVVTVLFLPFAALPDTAGKVLWYIANVLMVVAILRWTAVLVFGSVRAPPGFYALVLLLSLRFVDNNIGHGQLNILLLWLILGGYVLAGRGRFALAGLALAAAISAKLVPGVLLIQLLIRRQWRFVAATGGAFAVLMAAPLVWWAGDYPQVLRDWIAVVVDQAGHYEIGNKINQSIYA
ncbi:MAG: glycosyltransferase family 87 protein, partial [Candidatus Binatia bacterium]